MDKTVISLKGISIFTIPRNASTSIKSAVLEGMGFDYQAHKEAHQYLNLKKVADGWRRTEFKGINIYAVFLRNPFDRLVSAWVDGVLNYKDVVTPQFERLGYRRDMSFHAFLEQCKKKRDNHLYTKSQHFFCPKQDEVNFWGSVENLVNDWPRLRRLGVGSFGKLPLLNRNQRSRDWRAYYNQESYDLAKDIYRADLALWSAVTGKTFDPAKMRAFFKAKAHSTRKNAA